MEDAQNAHGTLCFKHEEMIRTSDVNDNNDKTNLMIILTTKHTAPG